MSNVNSHIQMPKCVLRNFADEQQTVHYFDFEENAIKIGRAASLNTELGYYSQDTEDYLRDNIETPFGKVMAFLKGISKDDTFSVSDTLFDDVRKFLYSLMSRSPNMLDSVTKSSAFFQFLPKQAQHDYVAVTGIQIAQNRGLFDDWQITSQPSCIVEGSEVRYCACGEEQVKIYAATGHSFGEWQVIKQATCTDNGEQVRYCACGERQSEIIFALGHSFEDDLCNRCVWVRKKFTCKRNSLQTTCKRAESRKNNPWKTCGY